MKIKLIIFEIFISLLLICGTGYAKNIPPGSGIGDVPANVLILLDKSGSMSARMTSGSGFMYPYSAAVDSSGDIYGGQYHTYGIKKLTYATGAGDSNFGSSGIYRGSGNCRSYYPVNMKVHNGYLYVASYYQHRVFRINLSNGNCDWNHYIRYARNLAISSNNILYATGYYGNAVVRNLSTNSNLSCGWSGNLKSYTDYGSMAVDASGSNLYGFEFRYLYRFPIASNGCPNTNYSSRAYRSSIMYSFGMDSHPSDDSVLYMNSYYEHKTYKMTLNANKDAFSSVSTVGKCCNGASKAGSVRMYYPWGLSVDKTNNRVVSASYYKGSINVFDLDLGFLKEFGGSAGTRMTGAHEAIKAIVTDSSLTAGVDFGFAYWSSGGAGFRSWSGNITTGKATPCSSRACLKVRAHKQGASQINKIISSVIPGGGTNADDWAKIAQDYYLHGTYSPVDKKLTCQNSYLLVIGDGDWYNHNRAKSKVQNLLNKHKIKTFTVAYGGGLSSSGVRNFRLMAQAGGTNDVIVANTTASLKSQLKAAISQIIASKLSFTAPAITATIEKGGSLYQAQFDYVQNQEWKGTLKKTSISSSGELDVDNKLKKNWSAVDMLPKPNSRKIWSEIPGTDYKSDLNNFKDANWNEINTLFQQTNNEVSGYHSKTDNPANSRRCASASGVENGTDDDVKGLINFIRGEDYFDYDADCNLTEVRDNPLGDIYHSELIVVGPPDAETGFASTNQEAYWRSINGYDAWAASKSTRTEMIYVGANDGMLHAFRASDGKEMWGFVPPFIASTMPNMVNVNLNRGGQGGSNAIYGVDGSPVVHDMFFDSVYSTKKEWHTIMMVPYGRGGAGFSVLDITDPAKPRHLYSVLNDTILHKVHVMDHNANITSFDYIASSYSLGTFVESVQVTDNYQMSTGSMTCDSTGNNQCYKSNTWTFPVRGVKKSDLTVLLDGKNYTNFSVTANSSGDTLITFGQQMTFYGGDPGDASKSSSALGVLIKPGSKQTGVQTQPEYDYSKLGETWSSPRIFRLPNNGAGDTNQLDDIYVAAMGGGFGAQYSGLGSNLTIVNLEDTSSPGRIHKSIPIEDLTTNDIVNSTPGSAVVVTADTARGVPFRGALVYLNDLEGKITKFNLTNMSDDGNGNAISLYDNTTLFTAGANTTNGRYMYHSMDATIGQTTNSLWLYAGTGDYERIADTSKGVQNLMLGINDPYYPKYREISKATNAADLTKCKNTTNDSTGANCPQLTGDKGWYITLDNYKKVTAEPTVSSGLVYFPIYKPSSSVNKCSLGDAYICAVDDECGTNFSAKLGKNTGNAQVKEKCKYVGQGVLSRVVVYAGKLFANIAGQADCSQIKDAAKKKECEKSKDLVKIDGATGDVTTYRSSWRQNY